MDSSHFLLILLFLLPPYVSNAVPVILGGGEKIDFGKRFFDGKRILGDGKTIRGFLAGISAGIIVAALESFALANSQFSSFNWFWIGCASSLGAMVGDIIGSFIKRRLSLEGSTPLLDQLPFILLALIFSLPFTKTFITILDVIIILVITYLLHVLMNRFAHAMGWKKVPW
jgi:CDP-2,3-bis-(O-geranylgeranyl)-sn-glycerol synthase